MAARNGILGGSLGWATGRRPAPGWHPSAHQRGRRLLRLEHRGGALGMDVFGRHAAVSLSLRRAALRAAVAPSTLRAALDRGELPGFVLWGGQLRRQRLQLDERDVDAWVAKRAARLRLFSFPRNDTP